MTNPYDNSGFNGSQQPYDPFAVQPDAATEAHNGAGYQQQAGFDQSNQYGQQAPFDQQNQYGQQPPYPAYQMQGQPQPSTGMGWAIAALVTAFVGLVTSPFLFGGGIALFSIPLGIVALVKGSKARKLGASTTGPTVMSIISFVVAAIAVVVAVLMGIVFKSALTAVDDCSQYQNDQPAMQKCIDEKLLEKFGVN